MTTRVGHSPGGRNISQENWLESWSKHRDMDSSRCLLSMWLVCVCVACGAWCRWWDLYLDIKSSDPSWFIREHGSSSFYGGLRCLSNLSYPIPCHVIPVVWGHCHPSPRKQASPNTSHPIPLLHSGCLLCELLKIFSLLIIYTYWEWSVLMCMICRRKFEVSKRNRWAGLKDLR